MVDAGSLVRNTLGSPPTSEAAEVGTPDILAVGSFEHLGFLLHIL